MNQVLETIKDKTGKFTRIEFFKGFYEADFDEQGRHLKSLLEIHERNDSKPGNEPTD
jgi:hypothetical protein